jgi:ribosomal protein S8E
MFFLLFPFLLFVMFVMFVMFGCYIKERKKKIEKWGRGVNCEEEIRKKNEMGRERYIFVVGEKKKEKQEYMGGGKKKKKKEIKKKKRKVEWGLGVWWENREVEKKEEKKI